MSGKPSVEEFLEACGARGPLYLSVKETGRLGATGRRFHQPFILVGRSAKADLRLDHPDVSRRHAAHQLIDGRLLCVDLGGRFPVAWDDGKAGSGWLDHGRSALIAPYALARRDHPEMSVPDDGEARQPRGFVVEVLDDPRGIPKRAYRVQRRISVVGRSPSCHVHVDAIDVSKAHCTLVETEAGLWVVDLLGRGGISIGGERARFARIEEGDVVQVGGHHLRFGFDLYPRWAPEAPPIPRRRPPELALPAIVAPAWRGDEGEIVPVAGGVEASQVAAVQLMMEPVIRQFGQMQRQMFDQFHRAMMTMFESIGGAYRDQMDDLREELDEVRRITRELHTLQTEAELRRDVPTPVPTADRRGDGPSHVEGAIRRPPPSKADVGVHGVLIDRIARLHDERQNRWSRILAKVNRVTP